MAKEIQLFAKVFEKMARFYHFFPKKGVVLSPLQNYEFLKLVVLRPPIYSKL